MEQASTENDVVKKSKQVLNRRVQRKADKKSRVQKGTSSNATSYSSFSLPAMPSHIEQKHYLQTAFKTALTGGVFIDTKFYAFSRRRSSGVVDKPLAVYANSSILRAASPYFEGLLARGFEEGKVANIDEDFPSDREALTEDYEYDSDSDLEDEEDLAEQLDLSKVSFLPPMKKHVRGEEEDYTAGPASTSTIAENLDVVSTDLRFCRLGRVVHIPDTAHTTWQAFVFFLCTGEITFRPLNSSPRSEQSPSQTEVDHRAPPCSPKSMYRLADRFGLDTLKQICSKEIQTQLKPQNAVPELFSEFTSRYPEIRDFELTYICNNSRDPVIIDTLPAWIEAVTNGSLPHSTSVMTLLLPRLMRK